MGFLDWLWGRSEDERSAAAAAAVIEPPSLAQNNIRMASSPPPAFNVESAIELMRALPFDENPELVLRVLRKTLRSTGVSVEQIIDSAKARESSLTNNVAQERAAIEQLEKQIAARRANIERFDGELQETHGVRERLEQAIESETKVAPMPPEIALLQAEAIAAGWPPRTVEAKPEPITPPTSQPPPVPKPSAPPLPKVGGPMAAKKPLVPKPPKPVRQEAPVSGRGDPGSDPNAVRDEASPPPLPVVAEDANSEPNR
jgi:DNA-binding transcriptional MerR regulator